jgi:predicted NAD/FAD-binding protein
MEDKIHMKIAIVGAGGAGLVAAWLLSKNNEVFVFEKQNRLGGHAYTVSAPLDGQVAPVDVGFEFFNDVMYPYFNNLLNLLNVSTKHYVLTSTYYNNQNDDCVLLPPIKNNKIVWENLTFQNISRLLQFRYVIAKAKSFLKKNDTSTTFQQFTDSLSLTQAFKNTFFYPFLAGGWGTPISELKIFSAFEILSWVVSATVKGVQAPVWTEIVGGIDQYVKVIEKQLLDDKAQIKQSTNITSIIYEDSKYKIFEETGEVLEVDHLILATNAKEAAGLLANIPNVDKLSSALSAIQFFPVKIAVHTDKRLMPKEEKYWSISNVICDNKTSFLTIYKPWRGEVFRSWISKGNELPEPMVAVIDYDHPLINHHYYNTQNLIKTFQGYQNLWFAGLHTNGIGSHESAVLSAIKIAESLCPTSERLNQLLKLK